MTRYRIVPETPTTEMTEAAIASTVARLNIPGSAMTVNLAKAAIRYRAMLAAAPLFEPTAEMVEAVARAMFGPANAVWDKRWAELHEHGIRETKSGFVDSKEAWRGQARAAITALVKAMEASDGTAG